MWVGPGHGRPCAATHHARGLRHGAAPAQAGHGHGHPSVAARERTPYLVGPDCAGRHGKAAGTDAAGRQRSEPA